MIQGIYNIQDSTFLSGFSNWMDRICCFTKHGSTHVHNAATDFIVNIPLTTSVVGDMLSSTHAKQKASNRTCFVKVARNIQFLTRQGTAFHGNGDEVNSSFMQLMHLPYIG